jgi:defect-in-organelle-trafficking protein DotC
MFYRTQLVSIGALAFLMMSLLAEAAPAGKGGSMSRHGWKASNESVLSKNNDRLSALHSLTKEVGYKEKGSGILQVRIASIKNAAFSWGVQEGIYWRYGEITKALDKNSLQLHTVFNFSKFIVEGKMLLPTVLKSERVFNQINDKSSRTYDVSISLDRLAKIVPQPPTWRDYIIRSIEEPQKPHSAMFPRNQEEGEVWITALDRGWLEGIKQADDIFEIDARRLEKEFNGLYQYKKLLAMEYFSLPRISSSHYPNVRYDNGKTINLNDSVYTITVESNINEVSDWEPYFRVDSMREELH